MSQKAFNESDRYVYNLNSGSIVMDCGAHTGTFCEGIARKYPCRIFAFEPVKKWAELVATKMESAKNVTVFPFGIASSSRTERFSVLGDSSSIFNKSDEVVDAEFVDWKKFIKDHNLTLVDLLKLNVEGMEYEILEDILSHNAASMFTNIQVQFHMNVPDFEARHDRIKEQLLLTHRMTMDFPYCWENFELK